MQPIIEVRFAMVTNGFSRSTRGCIASEFHAQQLIDRSVCSPLPFQRSRTACVLAPRSATAAKRAAIYASRRG